MKFLIKALLIAGITYFIAPYTPWYTIVGIGFFVNLIIRSSGVSSFLSGFVGVGVLWLTLAWLIDIENQSLLSNKIAQLFSLPAGWYMMLVAALIGGLATGFGALTGFTLRNLIQPPKKRTIYYR
jgi:hypothetical protein